MYVDVKLSGFKTVEIGVTQGFVTGNMFYLNIFLKLCIEIDKLDTTIFVMGGKFPHVMY